VPHLEPSTFQTTPQYPIPSPCPAHGPPACAESQPIRSTPVAIKESAETAKSSGMEAASLDEALDEAHNEAMHARVGAWVVQAAEATGVDGGCVVEGCVTTWTALAESAATSDNVEEGKGQDGAADSHDKDQEQDAEEEERGAEEERGVEAEAEVEAEAMEDKGVVEESEEQGVDDEAVQAEQDVEASGQDADDGWCSAYSN